MVWEWQGTLEVQESEGGLWESLGGQVLKSCCAPCAFGGKGLGAPWQRVHSVPWVGMGVALQQGCKNVWV